MVAPPGTHSSLSYLSRGKSAWMSHICYYVLQPKSHVYQILSSSHKIQSLLFLLDVEHIALLNDLLWETSVSFFETTHSHSDIAWNSSPQISRWLTTVLTYIRCERGLSWSADLDIKIQVICSPTPPSPFNTHMIQWKNRERVTIVNVPLQEGGPGNTD